MFPQTRTVDEAKAAAKYTLEKMSGYTVKYPVAVDVESKYILDYLSVQDLTNVVNAFCDTIAAAGYTPIVYSDYSKFTNEMDTNQIKYDLWRDMVRTDIIRDVRSGSAQIRTCKRDQRKCLPGIHI